jgi:hypothetical protein
MPTRRLRESEKAEMRRLREQDAKKWPYRKLAERYRCNIETAYRAVNGARGQLRPLEEKDRPDDGPPPPKRFKDLTPRNAYLLGDGRFQEWREEFFVRPLPWAPFHLEMAETITSDEDVIVLVPPGHAKTTTNTHDLVIWDMLRHRAGGRFYAALLVSQTDVMARSYVSRIRRTLERNRKLIAAYGAFRPEEDAMWREAAIRVWGFEDDEGLHEEKEPTFISAGRGTQIYGWRVRRIIADDLIGKKESLDPEATDKIVEWVHEELESRLEPGTNIAIVGTRFSPHELYARLLDTRDEDGAALYRPVIFKAHDKALCPGVACTCAGPCEHHPAYPAGCTLWPEKWPWRALRRIRARLDAERPGRFDFVYNQEQVASGYDVLCSTDDAERSKDPYRAAWTFPKGVQVICTVDLAAANWNVIQAWGYAASQEGLPGLPAHYLIAQLRERLTGPQIVTRIGEWTMRLRALGADPAWIIEANAFQRWLTQFDNFRQLRADLQGLRVIPHETGRNKLDPTLGVYALQAPLQGGKVSVPWHGPEEREMFAPLLKELVVYPEGATRDCVMAAWFYIHHVRTLAGRGTRQDWIDDPSIPPYLLGRRRQVAMYQ